MRSKRRRLGQHFLKSKTMAEKIVRELNLSPTDTVIEIGPGKGILTKELLKTGARILGVELDSRLVDLLRKNLDDKHLTTIRADFLKFDLSVYQGLKIIGNIPYQISTPLIEKLIKDQDYWQSSVLTFQSEFASRLMAEPRTKSYGSLSIFFQYHLNGDKVFDIPPRFFAPPPKVRSTVIRISSKNKEIDKGFQEFIQRLFSQRRKMLRSILKGIEIPDYYRRKRPEEISIKGMLKLHQFCQGSNPGAGFL